MNADELLRDILRAVRLGGDKGTEQAVRSSNDLLEYLGKGNRPPNMIMNDQDRKLLLKLLCRGIARPESKITSNRPLGATNQVQKPMSGRHGGKS